MMTDILDFLVEHWRDMVVSIGIVLAALLLGRWLIARLIDGVIRRFTRRTATTLDDAVLNAVEGPLRRVVLIVALQIAITRLTFLPDAWYGIADDIFFVLYVMVGFVILWRLVGNLFNWYGQVLAADPEMSLSEQLMPFFRRVTLILLSVIMVIALLGQFEVDVSGLLATLGVTSLAIALAAQAALEDAISGFMIMMDRPYRIGDRIEILDLDTWGDVVDIGLRSTRVRTRDYRTVIVPNSVIAKSLVVNYSYPNTAYRVQTHVGVAYGTDLAHAQEIMVEAVKTVPDLMVNPPGNYPVEALFLEFGDSALVFRVRWWIDHYVDTRRVIAKVNVALYNALNAEGIAVPFPQREISHKLDGETALQVGRMLRGE